MVKFEDNSSYKHIREIKYILSRDHFYSPLKLGNFEELYNLLMVSDITPEVTGEFTKFIYNALKIDPLDILTEVPDFFLTYTDLIEIRIPDHITVINDYAYAFTKNLKKVILPSNLEVISVSGFSNCYALEEITLPKTLKEIASFVSDKLSTLESVLSTATHFILKKYKDHGTIFDKKKIDEREVISP